ncbi:hypothetical protein ABPG75_013784 [Micractinium tetrahymenae]
MEDPAREGWAAGLLVSVTGAPRELRATLRELLQSAGGSYSPNLSRRCTHLAVHAQPGSKGAAPSGGAACSEKLRIAVRDRAKWGLHIVDFAWLMQSVQAGQRLDEAAFPATLPALPPPASGAKEQAAPNAAALVDKRPASSRRITSSTSSLLAADTYQYHSGRQQGLFSAATVAAAGARAQRAPPQALQQSVNSRPLSSFRQSARSLHTQSPSVKRSVRLQDPAASQGSAGRAGSTARGGTPGASAAELAAAAVAGVLPFEVEAHLVQQEDEAGRAHALTVTWSAGGYSIDFARLPMTQAGFIPGGQLLAQLQLLAPGPAGASAPANTASEQQQQQRLPAPAQWEQTQQRGSNPAPPAWGVDGKRQPQPQQQELWGMQVASYPAAVAEAEAPVAEATAQARLPAPRVPGSPMEVEQVSPEATQAQPPAIPRQDTASTAELLRQLQLSASTAAQAQQGQQQLQQQGQHLAAQRKPGLSTADLLAHLQASASSARPSQQQKQPLPEQQQHGHQQRHKPGLSTADLLEQLRASAVGAAPVQQQQQHPGQATHLPGLPTAELLEQLRASGSGAPPGQQRQEHEQAQQRVPGPPTADLLEQLRASASSVTLQSVRTAALQRPSPAGPAQHSQAQHQQPAAPSTALLLEAVVSSAGVQPAAPPLQHQPRATPDTDALLEQLRASVHQAGVPRLAHAAQSLQGVQGEQHGMQLQAPRRHGLSTAELLAQLQQPAPSAGKTAVGSVQGGSEGRAAELVRLLAVANGQQAAAPQAAGSSAAADDQALLLGLQGLAARPMQHPGQLQRQHHNKPAAPLLRQTPPPQQQQGPVLPQAHQPPPQQQLAVSAQRQAPKQQQQPAGSATIDAELPPAKYRRQEAPACKEPLPAAAVTAPHVSGLLPQTEAVLASGSDAMPAGSPASSAGSPPAAAGGQVAAAPAGHVWRLGPTQAHLSACRLQVADSGGKVFTGMLAVIDRGLPVEEQHRVSAALEKGGGCVADGGSLSRGVTHVVCQPEAALKWLSMGVGIVSPQWVHQSLRTGRQQRCLTVSADASRHLPAGSIEAAGSQPQQPIGPSSSPQQQQPGLSSELLLSREARQRMLSQLAGGSAGAAGTGGTGDSPGSAAGAAAVVPQGTTPAELLSDLVWSVLDPPPAARKEAQRPQRRLTEEDAVIIPDSEGEEEDGWAALCCPSASQAAVQSVLLEAAAGSGCSGAGVSGSGAQKLPGQGKAPAWQAEVVLSGAAQLTLLFPRDARGELGLDTRIIPLLPAVPAAGPRGSLQQAVAGAAAQRQLTAGALLALVHGYYAEQLLSQEQLHLLQSFPGAASTAAVLRPAFLELVPLARGALLGPRCSFEGLRKATREPAGAVYEVQLGQ